MSGRSDRCHTSELTVTIGPGQGAAGTIYGSLALRNHSDATCTLYGYPGLQLLDAARQALATQVDRGGSDGSALSGPPTMVTLAPRQVAHVQFKYSDVPTGPDAGATQCPRSTYLEVTPPDETDFLLLSTDIGTGGDIAVLELHMGHLPGGQRDHRRRPAERRSVGPAPVNLGRQRLASRVQQLEARVSVKGARRVGMVAQGQRTVDRSGGALPRTNGDCELRGVAAVGAPGHRRTWRR